mgnify:FL=1
MTREYVTSAQADGHTIFVARLQTDKTKVVVASELRDKWAFYSTALQGDTATAFIDPVRVAASP